MPNNWYLHNILENNRKEYENTIPINYTNWSLILENAFISIYLYIHLYSYLQRASKVDIYIVRVKLPPFYNPCRLKQANLPSGGERGFRCGKTLNSGSYMANWDIILTPKVRLFFFLLIDVINYSEIFNNVEIWKVFQYPISLPF